MATVPIPTPMRITGDLALEWRKFKRQYLNYAVASKLHEETPKRNVAIFLACIGSEALDIFASFDLSEEESDDVSKVISALENHFVPGFSEMTSPLRELLKKENEFIWDSSVHGKALAKLKMILSKAPVLQYFDVNKEVTLQCNSSQSGLGVVLLQNDKPVEFASRALTATEQSYAQIEKELLAVCFGMERMHTYVYGRKVKVETDHKPLIAIFSKSLVSAPKRLQRMLLRLQRYDLDLNYRPGSEVVIADALSRAYPEDSAHPSVFCEELASLDAEQEKENKMIAAPDTLDKIRQAAEQDKVYLELKKQIRAGWPLAQHHLPEELRPYFTFADELTVSGDFVYKGSRIVIPISARQWILERLHKSHIGLNGCLRRAREIVFWPGMTTQLQKWILACPICCAHQASNQKEPLLSHATPERPWQKVGVDIFTFRRYDYLIVADYSSSYFEVDRLPSKTASDVIRCLKSQFARHGLPDILFSDNGPPFISREFRLFTKMWEISHHTSSPRYPQSNGRVENAVKVVKNLMSKALEDHQDPFLALLDWRNTPSETTQLSPAQVVFGRRTRTLMPISHSLLQTPGSKRIQETMKAAKVKQASFYNVSAKDRPALKVGQNAE